MKTANRKLTCGLLLGCAVVLFMSSCGGGGGGSSPPASISFSTNSISFKAIGPYAAAPATQTLTGTVTGVTSGIVYFKVFVNNAVANSPNASFTVTNVTIANSAGQTDVIPAVPSSLGTGSFKGSISVTACVNDPSCGTGQLSGSPVTIPVEYDISSGVDGNTVTPRVVPASTPGTVILRGAGFTGATAVSFGSMAATSVSVVSDSEIDASYSALPAGTYPVTVDSGNISYSASLVAVSPPAFTSTTIPYPAGLDLSYPNTAGLEYDAQRSALFVLLPGGISTNSTLLRYAFDGSTWGAPTQISMTGSVQVHLSPDGTHLLVLVAPDGDHTSMVELDPVTLAQTNITTVANYYSSGTDAACGFAFADDGNAIVSNADSFGFAFGTFSRVLTPLSDGGGCSPVASGNGAVVGMVSGTFVTSSETVIHPGFQTGTGTTADFAGDKFVTAGIVTGQSGQVLGYATGLSGQLMNSAGTRLYGVTTDPTTFQPTLATVDLTATASGSPDPVFPQLGTPITLPGCATGTCPEAVFTLTATPDGATVFIAGPTYVVVQPISP
jgi:hypothetical protein